MNPDETVPMQLGDAEVQLVADFTRTVLNRDGILPVLRIEPKTAPFTVFLESSPQGGEPKLEQFIISDVPDQTSLEAARKDIEVVFQKMWIEAQQR